MSFAQINNQFGLFNFIRRYGVAIQELIEEINGFTTKTSGVYNPVNEQNWYKWKNVKKKPYKTDAFEFEIAFPITVIAKQDTYKNFNVNVIKSMKTLETIENLQIFKQSELNIIKPLNLSKGFVCEYITPLDVKPWVKSKFSPKLRGKWTESKPNTNVNIIEDVGTISEIEMLNIIGMIEEVEMINAI